MAHFDRFAQTPAGGTAEVFAPPSSEAECLVRHLGWLVAPADGQPRWYTRLLGVVVVAPFTQFTLVSFDLQTFLFKVFHTRIWARLGHGLFMPMVNFFVMAALAQLRLGLHPESHGWSGPSLNGATIYAAVLLLWYFIVAASKQLYLWWALTAPFVLALALGADAYYCHTFSLEAAARTWYAPTPLVFNPYLWMAVAASIIAASHVPEPRLPPRVGDSWRWLPLREAIFGTAEAPNPLGVKLVRFGQVALQVITGSLNEWWASPRLMPYNLLLLMFNAGYKPALAAEAHQYAERALASGNPAIDYVGIGGGAFLQSDVHRGVLPEQQLPRAAGGSLR